MRTLSVILLSVLLASCSMLGMGEPSNQLEIVEYGIFRNGVLVKQTTGVPREMGSSFGYRFKVKDPKAAAIKAKIITATPGLIDPALNKVQQEFVTETTLQAGETYEVIFTFSQPWEMVQGSWELRVETDKGEVLSQKFDVYKPQM
ncbi:MAG: DUF3859 domain-containing protein [Acidobacteriota bacterium]